MLFAVAALPGVHLKDATISRGLRSAEGTGSLSKLPSSCSCIDILK